MHTTVGLLLALAASANAYVAPGVMSLTGSRSVAMSCSLSEGKTRRQALFQVCSLAALLSAASFPSCCARKAGHASNAGRR